MNKFDPKNGEAQVIVGVADAALHMYHAAIESLPFPEDKKFQKRAEVVLTGLRKLRASLTEAATYSRSTSTVIATLSEVRRIYDELIARAAAAPNATLGQQLYAVRVRANLSAVEAALGVGLRPELPDELEEGATPTADEANKVQDLIEALGGIPRIEDLTPPAAPSDADLNGAETETNGVALDPAAN